MPFRILPAYPFEDPCLFERRCHRGAHHERLDGKGYPRGLLAEEISIEVRIVSTADVFNALTADRPYRSALPIEKVIAILWEGQGQSHDPICIEALKRAFAKTALKQAA